jgi:hypothetical protein
MDDDTYPPLHQGSLSFAAIEPILVELEQALTAEKPRPPLRLASQVRTLGNP